MLKPPYKTITIRMSFALIFWFSLFQIFTRTCSDIFDHSILFDDLAQLEHAVIELVVVTFFLHQLFVISALDNPSLIHDDNAVGIADRRQSVRNHKCCTAIH